MGCACCGAAAGVLAGPLPAWADGGGHGASTMTPDEALSLLKAGNAEFVADTPFHGPENSARRLEIAKGQHPFAVLVGCSDSRVSPELLFGRGLGELFIVRVAGNSVGLVAQGSIEYAVEELGVPLILVLGHERCGAVAAAVKLVKENASFPGAIDAVVEPIVPAVLRAQRQEGEQLSNTESENKRGVVERLIDNGAIVPRRVAEGSLKVVGACYDLDDGKVDFFLNS